jgi:hypothetical protein
VLIAGSISSQTGMENVTLNGSAISLTGAANTYGTFQYPMTLAAGVANTVTIVATDTAGQSTTRELTLYYDPDAPQVAITTPGIQPAPTANSINETPYTLEGTITEANLAGFSINGQTVGLLPGTGTDTYEFSSGLTLFPAPVSL